MLTTRRMILGASLGATAGLLTQAARAQARPGYLRFGLSAYPPNLQPWQSTGAAAGTVKLQLHRSLLGYDNQGELRGELAQSWSLDPEGAWVFKLRPGAVFHNGEPVTADDVKWTIGQVASEKSTAYMRTQFQSISEVQTPDPMTVRLVTKTPQATLPIWFANYSMSIIWRKSDPNNPIGAGPFTLVSQERGVAVELAAFDKYYRPGLPKLRGIRFVAYADENLRTAALKAGDVDMIDYVPWQAMAAIAADPRLTLAETQGAAMMNILFNGTRPPFNDPRVRRAMAHAVKREDIVQAVFFGRGKGLEGLPIAEGTPYFDPVLARGWNYDPGRAKELLAAAGLANGFQTSILATAQYSMHKDTAVVVQQHLAAIGVQCDLHLPEWSSRVNLGMHGQYDMAIFGAAPDSNDPDGLSVLMDPTLAPTYGRSFGVQAPRTAAALARGRGEFDQAKRVQIYRDMQVAALEEVPTAGLAWRSQGFAMDKRATGFVNLPAALSAASGYTLEETAFT
jgi:peptide/nickel transport system substrate-binding protein